MRRILYFAAGSSGILAPILWFISTRIRDDALDDISRINPEINAVWQEIAALGLRQGSLVLFNWIQITGMALLIVAALGAYRMVKPSGSVAPLALAAISAGAVLSILVRAIDLGILYAIVPEFTGTAADAQRTGLIDSYDSIVPVQNFASDLSLALRSGIGALLVGFAVLRSATFPKWFAWASFVVAIPAWLELFSKIFTAAGEPLPLIGDIRLQLFRLWVLAVGILIYRYASSLRIDRPDPPVRS